MHQPNIREGLSSPSKRNRLFGLFLITSEGKGDSQQCFFFQFIEEQDGWLEVMVRFDGGACGVGGGVAVFYAHSGSIHHSGLDQSSQGFHHFDLNELPTKLHKGERMASFNLF